MAIVAADWTITRSTKVIAYIGDDHSGSAPSYATVIEFHRWLQGLADDAVASGDDELDITNIDPSRRSTDNIITLINGYTIGDNEAEHLYDGSIIYDGGDEIYDGIVNFGNSDVQIQIIQNGAVLTDDWWNYDSAGLNPNATAGISHRFMIKTRTGGTDIDGRRLIGTCRRFGFTYAEFSINGTARGNNVLALTDSDDLNNNTIVSTVAAWDQFENDSVGYVDIDVDNNGTDEHYYSQWDITADAGTDPASPTINDFYEYAKWLTMDGSAQNLYGLNGELFRGITHQVVITDLDSGDWNQPEALSWGSGVTAGTGQLLIPNANTITGATNSATGTAGTVTERTISKPFCGASTGSAIIGSYGLGFVETDLTSSDKVTDLGNNVITPPNYVTNTVAGLVSGEDRVLVGPWDGSSTDVNGDPAIDKDQLSLSGNLTSENISSIVVSEAIPSDTPSSGVIRVTDDNGYERWIPYSSWDASTFMVNTSHGDIGDNNDFNGVDGSGTYQATSGNDVWIAYIDKLATATSESFTSVQSGSRSLVVIVRDGAGTPIKQFISSWSQTASASTINAIRTTDA
ncbi:MAG: hypothetical protein B7C24_16710 [Bacteroidetes bacterium 4572_77]|nr:MAG: hypothetical protein B7C24_16710 [Bacteroidetes bacterium 4572_77]